MKKLFFMVFLIFSISAFAADTIKIGAIFDFTGGTADVGKPYAEGVKDCVRWFNEKGGINGKKIELFDVDYSYKVPNALAAYKDFKMKGVVAIHGWGTADTEALTKFVAQDKIPYLSASYSEHLADGKKTPYNFFVGASYSDQTEAALQFIKDNKGKTVAFIYNDTGFGRSPFFPDGENAAKKLGIQLVDKQVVDLKALDATAQMLNLKKSGAEYAIVQETYMATSTILKDAKKNGLTTKFIGLNWTFDRPLIKLAGDAANGFYGVSPFAFWSDTDVEGIKFLRELNKKYHPDVHEREINYIQGFSSMYVLLSAIKNVKGPITGESIKHSLESMRDFSTMGLTPPVTFTPDIHKGVRAARIYQIQNGQIKPVSKVITLQ
ncbi:MULTISPECIES: ABC transporter substrate-binding protein [Calditerrivibrio]|uniref:Branched-chain amino acid ABC transporter substrate-binding protein n=1 Tax=Calditerrivibrio nitroreducens TaxID=477976 RepID=A0A2J6WPE1_9BACT|nr:MAG: branched-chain amino acid ABC transporter substrate-binding protein [Calditerrivibrio nitroreducens]